MSIIGQMFSKKKELRGPEIASLLSTLSVLREPVIVKTESFKFVTDVLAYDQKVFHVKTNISRDEVVTQLKGRELHTLIPYELTMFGGSTALVGLGVIGGIHTLKLRAPEVLVQEESRGAYRVSRFAETPIVTFTTDNLDIVKARLQDISMTGAGLRLDPRWERSNSKLTARTSIILDIRINDQLRISTTASVRYARGYKCGVQFDELGKGVRDKLFKFVVEQRREEQRALMKLQEKTPLRVQEGPPNPDAPPKEEVDKPKDRPTVLIVGDREDYVDFLTATLTRQFDILHCSSSITDLRAHIELGPNLCLIELREENLEQVSSMRKASSLLPSSCVLMFYGHSFTPPFATRFENYGYAPDILITLHEAKKLLLYKQIQNYYTQRAPR